MASQIQKKVTLVKKEIKNDPNWNDLEYVLKHYKTQKCQIGVKSDAENPYCELRWACPFYHGNYDRRRANEHYKSRSGVKPCEHSFDKQTLKWLDPSACPQGDSCRCAHSQVEIQYNMINYKKKPCRDLETKNVCIRGRFCAFQHLNESQPSSHTTSRTIATVNATPNNLPDTPSINAWGATRASTPRVDLTTNSSPNIALTEPGLNGDGLENMPIPGTSMTAISDELDFPLLGVTIQENRAVSNFAQFVETVDESLVSPRGLEDGLEVETPIQEGKLIVEKLCNLSSHFLCKISGTPSSEELDQVEYTVAETESNQEDTELSEQQRRCLEQFCRGLARNPRNGAHAREIENLASHSTREPSLVPLPAAGVARSLNELMEINPISELDQPPLRDKNHSEIRISNDESELSSSEVEMQMQVTPGLTECYENLDVPITISVSEQPYSVLETTNNERDDQLSEKQREGLNRFYKCLARNPRNGAHAKEIANLRDPSTNCNQTLPNTVILDQIESESVSPVPHDPYNYPLVLDPASIIQREPLYGRYNTPEYLGKSYVRMFRHRGIYNKEMQEFLQKKFVCRLEEP